MKEVLNMTIFDCITLGGGLALFLYGMRLMGDGLQSGSSETLKKAMEKVTNNQFIGFLLGFFVTCVIQSSTATIVLTAGLVTAGILSMHQSVGVILGANVGTTVTGQIIRLLDINAGAASWLNLFKPSTLAPAAAIIGIVLIMAFKFKNSDTYGTIAMGFGILFTGLINMTAAVTPLSESTMFVELLEKFSQVPVLGFVIGAAAAFMLHSSSATIGIIQAMASTGMLVFSSVYSIIIGVNIGECASIALFCAIGAKKDAKRMGIIFIIYNICSAILIIALLMIGRYTGMLDGLWDQVMTSGTIANTHSLFRIIAALTMLPFCNKLEALSLKVVKGTDDDGKPVLSEVQMLDDKLFSSPALALGSANNAITKMAAVSKENAIIAMNAIMNHDSEALEKIRAKEDIIDTLADNVDNYLIRFSPQITTEHDNTLFNFYIQSFSEFERIGDLAVNLAESVAEIKKREAALSDDCVKEIGVLKSAVEEILCWTYKAYTDKDTDAARYIEPIEEVVDDLVATIRKNHVRRLRKGTCNIYSGVEFLDILTNIERIADQCSNIGIYVLSLSDLSVAKSHHEYVSWLHHGNDDFFNREYENIRAKYYSMLEKEAAVK